MEPDDDITDPEITRAMLCDQVTICRVSGTHDSERKIVEIAMRFCPVRSAIIAALGNVEISLLKRPNGVY